MKKLTAFVLAPLAALSSTAHAAIDLTAVDAGITAATTSGETVGGYVLVAIAALVVISVIAGIVKKL